MRSLFILCSGCCCVCKCVCLRREKSWMMILVLQNMNNARMEKTTKKKWNKQSKCKWEEKGDRRDTTQDHFTFSQESVRFFGKIGNRRRLPTLRLAHHLFHHFFFFFFLLNAIIHSSGSSSSGGGGGAGWWYKTGFMLTTLFFHTMYFVFPKLNWTHIHTCWEDDGLCVLFLCCNI